MTGPLLAWRRRTTAPLGHHRIRNLFAGALVVAAALTFTPGAALAHGGGHGAPGAHGAKTQFQLALVRAVTAPFLLEPIAVKAGYLRTDACVSSPAGAMGYHYVKPSIFDTKAELLKPEALLYVDSSRGRRLVGVEYVVVDADQDLSTDDDRPSLFGHEFDGPMPGHEPGMPIHYDLHVWLWSHNPSGMFSMWNPSLSC